MVGPTIRVWLSDIPVPDLAEASNTARILGVVLWAGRIHFDKVFANLQPAQLRHDLAIRILP